MLPSASCWTASCRARSTAPCERCARSSASTSQRRASTTTCCCICSRLLWQTRWPSERCVVHASCMCCSAVLCVAVHRRLHHPTPPVHLQLQLQGMASQQSAASGATGAADTASGSAARQARTEAEEEALEKDVSVDLKLLAARGREYGIHNMRTITSFTKAPMFASAGFRVVRGHVVRSFAQSQ